MADSEVLCTQDVLCQELNEIEARRRRRTGGKRDPGVQDDLETYAERAERLQLSALCLSGGGIRSAAFCLGVLQSLAGARLLRQFDYLSTVSGGGFIGGWLQALIRQTGGVSSAEEAIAQPRPDALRRLRAFTNYLTPQTGPLSIDTWAGIVLYLRNFLINWTVFAPLFLLLVLVPIMYRTAISVCSDFVWANLVLLVCAILALLFGVIRACSLLPSHRPPRSLTDATPAYASTRSIGWSVVYPAIGWTLLIPWLLDLAGRKYDAPLQRPWLGADALWMLPLIYLAVMLVAYCIAWLLQSHRDDPGILLFRGNFGSWFLASIGSALLTWLLLQAAFAVLPLEDQPFMLLDTATGLTVFAPIALAIVHVLQTALFVSLRHETSLADLDREWLGRVNAMILRLAAGWTVFALCCLILPLLLDFVSRDRSVWSAGHISSAGALTLLIGGAAAWLGKIWPSVEELAEKPGVWDRVQAYLPTVLGVVFAACLLIVFGGVMNFVLARFQLIVAAGQTLPNWSPLLLQLPVAVILLAGIWMFRQVNVNRFSMHAVYRNRLTRAFLGSARSRREQDPFTGFDPQDNMPLSSLLHSGNALFPVINTTLNITAGKNNAWAERQAASFTATPLACGSAALRHPSQASSLSDPGGAYVPTVNFAGLETHREYRKSAEQLGPGFGSILTVSGAAVSSSWGYHSSRITSFLMTLFNVRLGIWLANPSTATEDDLRLARPRNSLMALINEMLGETTDDSQAIYLSDGGHFDNLGVYEMLRRRCSSILIVDAGADEACTLFDLGNAIRKAEIDFGITVGMREPMHIYGRAQLEADKDLTDVALGYAFATVDYGAGHIGQLLYLKPSLLPRIPADVRSYGAEHKTFPHESTLDQWFSESQFESYRMLGRYQMAELADQVVAGDLAALFTPPDASDQRRAATTCGDDGGAVIARIEPVRDPGDSAAAE